MDFQIIILTALLVGKLKCNTFIMNDEITQKHDCPERAIKGPGDRQC